MHQKCVPHPHYCLPVFFCHAHTVWYEIEHVFRCDSILAFRRKKCSFHCVPIFYGGFRCYHLSNTISDTFRLICVCGRWRNWIIVRNISALCSRSESRMLGSVITHYSNEVITMTWIMSTSCLATAKPLHLTTTMTKKDLDNVLSAGRPASSTLPWQESESSRAHFPFWGRRAKRKKRYLIPFHVINNKIEFLMQHFFFLYLWGKIFSKTWLSITKKKLPT